MRVAGRDIAVEGIRQARDEFATDKISMDEFEAEAEFWLSVGDCDRCNREQMCTSHFDRFYGGW